MSGNSFKVDFVVGGAQKGGTTALDFFLRKHPKICMANRKEVHFFDSDTLFMKKYENILDYYHSFFKNKNISCLSGETTPIYMYWYRAPQRVWEYNPAMKWILILRNPILRAFSHWNMEFSRGNEKLDFFDAILNERERCRKALPFQHRIFSYVDRGFYSEQIRRIWHFFPKSQVLVLKNDDLKGRLDYSMSRVFAFLGINSDFEVANQDIHSTKYSRCLVRKEFDFLKEKFLLEIRQLEKMFGWDCADWLDFV